MSKFTKQIKRTYQFDGDEVYVVMDRLKRKDALKIAPLMNEPDENGKVKMSFEDSMKFTDVASGILKKYITVFTGLKDEDGVALVIEDIFGEDGAVYFMELISEIIGDLMEASFATEDNEKKSESTPTSTSQESEIVEKPSA